MHLLPYVLAVSQNFHFSDNPVLAYMLRIGRRIVKLTSVLTRATMIDW